LTVLVEWNDRKVHVSVGRGERLLDALDDSPQTGTVFACRGAHCGTCRVRVLAGAETLLPAADDEAETLRGHQSQPEERLACQIRICSDDGVVRLRSVPIASISG
jgi:ferredoxin